MFRSDKRVFVADVVGLTNQRARFVRRLRCCCDLPLCAKTTRSCLSKPCLTIVIQPLGLCICLIVDVAFTSTHGPFGVHSQR